MTLPLSIEPISGVAHLAMKYPAIAVVCTALAGGTVYANTTNSCVYCDLSKEKVISFTFDDGLLGVSDLAKDVFVKHQAKASAYLVTDRIGTPEYMNWEQVKDLQANGWEIGSHTVTHPDLTKASDEELHRELVDPIKVLEDQGIRASKTFPSPYGYFNDKTMWAIEESYDSHLLAYSRNTVNALPTVDPYYIRRYHLTNTVDSKTVCNEIATAPTGSWYVFMLHQVVEGEAQEYQIPVQVLDEIVECAKAYNVLTVEEVVGLFHAALDK